MHYQNGREAKNGDKVILFSSYGPPVAGILYDAVAGNDYCNGKIAPTSTGDPCPNLKEVLHYDDVKKLAFEAAPSPSSEVLHYDDVKKLAFEAAPSPSSEVLHYDEVKKLAFEAAPSPSS